MGFESTPGVSSRVVVLPKSGRGQRKTETIFTFDLSRMTLATALADPTAPKITMSEWTVDQLFRVMLEPADAPQHSSELAHKKEIAALRPAFLRRFVWALQENPLNRDVIEFAAQRDPKSQAIVSFSSTYAKPGDPTKPTVLHVSAEATLLQTSAAAFGVKREVRDDLLRPRSPAVAFINYVAAFLEQNLKPLQELIAKNDADVRKALAAVAYVQQINVALKFAEDASQMDRSVLWRDFFEHWEPPTGAFSPPRAQWEKLLWHDENLFASPLNSKQIDKLHDFRRERIDPLIEELGNAAAWARAGAIIEGRPCASAKARDEDAKRRIHFLRTDKVILDALEHWDELGAGEKFFLSYLFDEMMAALSQCPGATESLLTAEFVAVARGADGAMSSAPVLPRDSSQQKLIAEAIEQFDVTSALGRLNRTPLTDVIVKAFKNLEKARKIPVPIVTMWAHSTPALLARFDKATPGRINLDGTAWLYRSVFGMGTLNQDEMKALFSDLDAALESAVKNGISSSHTKRRLRRIFKKELSDGKYAVGSNWWSDGRVFSSFKLVVALLGIRQAAISALDEKALPQEAFLELSNAILRATGAIHDLRPVLKTIFGAGNSAVHHTSTFLDKLPSGAALSMVTAAVSVALAQQAVGKTEDATYARQLAEADIAVAFLSLSVAVIEGAAGMTFPIAGLALILLRWGLFHQGLWDLIGGVESASPMVKVVRGIMAAIEDEDGDIGAFLRTAPNWAGVEGAIGRVRVDVPETVPTNQILKFPLFFHLETKHDGPLRSYAGPAYGLAIDVVELIVES